MRFAAAAIGNEEMACPADTDRLISYDHLADREMTNHHLADREISYHHLSDREMTNQIVVD